MFLDIYFNMIYFKIKNIPIRQKGILAPMQEYTHLPFRLTCKEYLAGFTTTEMININHILKYKDDLSKIDLLKSTNLEKPCAVQIFGDFSLKKTLKAISLLDDYKYFDIIDLNLGCPSKKIINSKSGAYNLKQFKKVLPIIEEAVQITKKPITVKTRLGFKENQINYIYSSLLKTNISAISIHGRLATENYSTPSKFKEILNLQKSEVPIIYNGDVFKENLCLVNEFKGVMVGRACLGNPFIFKQIDYFSKKNIILETEDFLSQLKLFLEFVIKYPIPFKKLKVSIIPFFKGKKGSSKIRDLISKSKNESDLIIKVNKLIKQLEQSKE